MPTDPVQSNGIDEIVSMCQEIKTYFPDQRKALLNPEYEENLKTGAEKIPDGDILDYIRPTSTADYDLSLKSTTTGMACMDLQAGSLKHKVPLDQMVVPFSLAKVDSIDNTKVVFPYGYNTPEDRNLTVKLIRIPINTYEEVTKRMRDMFARGLVYPKA